MPKKKRVLIFHPFLFAVFPILFLFAHNLGGFRVEEIYGLVAKAFGFSLAAWVVLALGLRNARRAALILSLFIVLFSSFGHVSDLIRIAGFPYRLWGWGPAAMLAPVYLAIFVVGTYFLARAKSDLVNLTRILNVSAAFLVVFSGSRIASYELKVRRARELAAIRAGKILRLKRPWVRRNIYYIILDAYGRSDVLKELYGHDNAELMGFLRSEGFYIAANSRANYGYTLFSLATSLNFDYPVNREGILHIPDWVPLKHMISDCEVSRLLKEIGYRYVFLGGDPDEVKNADISPRPNQTGEFAAELLRTTAAGSLVNRRCSKREEVLFCFDQLPKTAEMHGPLFVFAHITVPHRPFVFASDGSDPGNWGNPAAPPTHAISKTAGIPRSEYIKRYREQIAYTDKLVTKAVKGILECSSVAPIIVIQGDHGPAAYHDLWTIEATYLKERMSILNAYYLPDGPDALLYDSITPVNTFRVIFKHYFGAKVALREDRSLFSPGQNIWDFTDVAKMIDDEADKKRLEMLKGMEYFPEFESPAEAPLAVKDAD